MAAGLSAWHGDLRPAPWPPILERDVWERLRDKLTDPSRRTGTSNEPKWLVSKFTRCGVCGCTMHVTAGGQRAPSYTGDECNHVARDAHHVDDYVAGVITERLSRPDAADLLKPPPRPGVDAAALRAEQRKLRERKAAQARMHARGDIDDEQLASGSREIRARLAVIDAQLAASDQPDPLEEFRGKPAAAVWKSLRLPRKRAVVQALIESIAILPAGRGRPAAGSRANVLQPGPGADRMEARISQGAREFSPDTAQIPRRGAPAR